MKNIDKSNLQLNKFINVFKYIVLIAAFILVGVFGKEIVQAADCDVEYSSNTSYIKTDCDTNETYTHVNSTDIGIPVYFNSQKDKYSVGGSFIFKICKKGSGSTDCTSFSLFSVATSTKVTAIHFVLSKNGGAVSYKYQVDGNWQSDMKQYTSTEYTNFLNSHMGTTYQTEGFRIEVYGNMYKRSKKLECSGYSDSTGLPTNCGYKNVHDRVGDVAGGWDVPAYYIKVKDPSISITETNGSGTDISTQYMKSHSPTITVNDSPSARTTVYYCWFDSQKSSIPWNNCEVRVSSGNGNVSIKAAIKPNLPVYEETIPASSFSGTTKTITRSSGNGTKYLYVKSVTTYDGNIIVKYANKTFNFDNAAPLLTSDPDDYYQKTRNLVFKGKDVGGSGLSSTFHYCISTTESCSNYSTATIDSSGQVTVSFANEGEQYINFYFLDNAGNQSITFTNHYFIDVTKPTIPDADTWTEPLSGWLNKNSSLSLELNVTDRNEGNTADGSGIVSIEYYWEWKDPVNSTSKSTNAAAFTNNTVNSIEKPSSSELDGYVFSDSNDNPLYLVIVATDNAGNKQPEKKSYNYDGTAPVITIGSADKNGRSNSFKISFLVEDTGSEIVSVTYCWLDGNNTVVVASQNINYPTTKTRDTIEVIIDSSKVPANYEGGIHLEVNVTDKAGNSSEASSSSVSLDVKAPTISFIPATSSSQRAIEVVESVMMSYSDKQEVFETLDIEEAEEMFEEEIKISENDKVEEKQLVKTMNNEVIQVEHNHIPSTMSILDYVLGSLKSSIMIGGTYLFIKQRKRVNVS